MPRARVVDILTLLAAGGPAVSWPTQLVGLCRTATQMSGVGLALMGRDGVGEVLATTGRHAQRMEDLQFSLGEGPCVDASRSGQPVLVADLSRDGATRWPAFTHEATGVGIRAAFTFPLQVGAFRIGVLDLYRTTRGSLNDFQVTESLAFADAAVAVLLHLQDGLHGQAGATLAADGADRIVPAARPAAGRPADPTVNLAEDVERRSVVHQAAGMISVQLDVTLPVALSRLRAHAYVAGRPILEVADDVVGRRLRFDHSDTGTMSTPPRQHPRTTGEQEPS